MLKRIAFQENTLQVLARDLLAALPGSPRGDLSAALVLLPSARACRSLGHAILEASGRDTLLLPRIQTVTQWSGEMEAALGLAGDKAPDNRTRPLILAPHLAALPWLADNPESAPGLARELIGFFDEARLHDQAELLLDPARLDDLQTMVSAAEADVLVQDMSRVHEAWAIYRGLVPLDETDRLVRLSRALVADPPQPLTRPELVIVAGFARVDPMRAGLLKVALDGADEGRVYVPSAKGDLAELFLTTWGAEPGPTDPLAPGRKVEQLLVGEVETAVVGAATLRARLDKLKERVDPQDLMAPKGALELIPCGGAEAESRLIADRVAQIQSGPDGGTHRVTIAVNDPKLAARIGAHLWDAGIDTDMTHGDPLSALPAGLLARFLLRAALTDLRIEPLLEVLAHPYVKLPVADGFHGKWTLRLEQMYRRDKGPRGGLSALHCRADERDEAVLNLIRDNQSEAGPGMVDFVTLVADAFAPLLPFGDGKPRPWAEMLAALRETWTLLAGEYPLDESDRGRPDIGKLDQLLSDLARDGDILPPATLADFSSDLGRLLSDENAAAHRKPNLPVVVSGMVEARLERSDTLIMAGLRDGVFPKKSARPLFLASALRERLGLPGWPAALSRDAELFTRLLHGAPRVMLTWSTEEAGSPALPSSFVSRLELVLQPELKSADSKLWRVKPTPWDEIAAAEKAFREADRDVRTMVPIRPLTKLSWSALRSWRDCPYRYVLERGFALRREEEVQEEFQAMDYGNLVHEALQEWLDPKGPGYQALTAGDAAKAEAALDDEARAQFDRGFDEMPQRKLWFESFRVAIPALVKVELGRFADWRPVALEQKFELPLPKMREWTLQQAAALDCEIDVPELPAYAADILLRGTVDRVDLHQDGTGAVSVIDYKTGSIPSGSQVKKLEEMQILLYAVAAEMGELDLPGDRHGVREAFYYAVNPEKPGGPKKPHLAGDDDEGRTLLIEGAAKLIGLAVEAANPKGAFPVLPREMAGTAPTNLPCTYCDFRGVCRVEELTVPPGTERKLDKLINRKDQG